MTRSALVYIFGDQSENYIAGLRCLLQSPQSDQTLRHFLTQSYEGIIREISQQSYCPEYLAVHTSSLRDLLSNEAERYVPLQHALATLYHFAAFIHRCHQSEGVYVLRDHPATYLIGLCTGSLAAATISCLDSLVNLLPVAVDVVRLSFRVGAVAANIARAVAGEGKTRPLTWALGCAGLLPETADAVIKTLVRDHTLPDTARPILAMSDITSVKVIPIASSQAQRIIPSLQGVDVHIQSDLLGNSNDSPSGMSLGASAQGPRFALVGMAGRFPNAEDTSAFWDLILQGLDVHRVVPDTRWDPHTHVDPSGQRKNTSQTGFGCWLDRPELFDARFFGISPREAEQMDPAQRLALMTAYEAMEDGGIVADRTPSTRRDRMGVIYGVTSNDWMETNSAQNIDTYFIPGGNRAFIPGRVNYCFKLGGPGFSVDTACSSSLAALHIACNMLRTREADTMLVGGTNVLTNPDFTSGLDRGHFLSRTGNCKTFDETADGYCRGEGVVTLVIKRLEDALADRDPIRGVIANIATNHSAEAASITKPHVQNQAALFRHVLDGISPADISYVEMHGTGTQAGDTCEMAAVSTVLAPGEAGQCRSPSQPLYVGAVKSNVGHGEAVAGACSLVKALLMMEHGTIPPHAGIKTTINHEFPSDLFDRGIRIARQPVPWNRPARGLRRVLVNNFSAAGGNTALLLEDGPIMDSSPRQDPRGTYIITLSARSATALQGNVRNLLRLLNDFEEQVPLPSLSYTTTARRMHHSYRAAVPASTIDALKAGLSKLLEPEPPTSTRARHPSIIFLFTGQASEYRGMGKALFDQVPSFRSDIIRHNQLACKLGFGSFLPVIRDLETDINAHTLPAVHLAIVCLQMALSSLLKTWGIQPRAVTGHSLGYYAALNAAGVLTEADTIFLVGSRSQLIERECEPVTHAMLAVKCSVAAINHLLADTTVTIACINGPEDVVLSGPQDAITRVRTRLATEAIYATPLALPYAFHSAQMEGILDDFRALAAGVSFRPPAIPLLCPLTGRVVTQPGIIDPGYLANHTRRRVDMADNILSMTCETDLSNPRLRSIITGHVVNGIPVCTPAIYCDIALTLGAYIRDVHYQDSERLQIEVADMSIDKALVPHSVNPHTLRTTVDVDVAQRQAHCGFVTDHGEEVIIHATCTLVFVSPVAPYWAASWKAEAFHTQSTLGDRASTQTQSCYRFNKMMVYRMVGPVAVFDSEYQGLDNVILDSEMMAATGQVYCPLAQSTDSSSFHIYPPLLDAFTQLAGFAMNVNIYSDLESEVYVNHGWRSLQIFTELLPDRTYRGTVKLRKKEKSSWEGTLYLLYEDRLVCRIDGLILLGVPKRLLNQVLSSAQRAQQPALSAKTTLDTDKQELDLLLDSPGDRHTKVLDIISEESGISRATLNNSTTFMSIGIDSLLSLLITAHLRDEIGFDLGPRGTIFDHYQTVGELQEAVEQYFTHDGSENATPFTMTDSTELAQPCTSIVLHSVDPTCSTPHKYLFLFPDGSGSAHSYARLPCIDPSVTTVGLVCPYRTNPDKMLTSCTLDALIASYLHEIRRRQPHGPYSLGGWSAGGILAYRAAQTLLDAGEPIAHLFLLDSPPPQHGLSELPEWFLNRFTWEQDDGVAFLTERRTDLSTRPWADLFPAETDILAYAVDADHFSMMVSAFLDLMLPASIRRLCLLAYLRYRKGPWRSW
ncbi:ketoacyl-synt-domain-containing protein [Aspergillus homomorphus CBS 101889]|uniref:Ketoacyl-synt-domain-containing protein n=1 Tax=Aspergillus homomorphus (strain CBS 101889) TaxID=1450537 RepID=A0A395I9C5_ASPHC|nr:ketoacyl-synt-domain-containing protein [Aspergillus homomorphus CBS 101889]RAL16641.1 ketoacyl-synt-domain-containing protein [Aspergillus homomorphus CBS 101889]